MPPTQKFRIHPGLVGFFLAIIIGLSGSVSYAANINTLVDTLVDKKILTPSEGEAAIYDARDPQPPWVLKGDYRVRFDSTTLGLGSERNRFRIRLRAGTEIRTGDGISTNIRIATGGNPRSTNQTAGSPVGSEFSPFSLYLDQAYLSISSGKSIVLMGKIQNPLWTVDQLVWDTDINPTGVAITGSLENLLGKNSFGTLAYYVLDEVATGPTNGAGLTEYTDKSRLDPYVLAIQMGTTVPLGSSTIKAATNILEVSYIDLNTSISNASAFPTDTWLFGLATELTIPNPALGPVSAGQGKLFAEWINNTRAQTANYAWLAGVEIGHKSIAKTGDWILRITHRRIETNSIPAILPDNDILEGRTGTIGTGAKFTVGIGPQLMVSTSYFTNYLIDKGESGKETWFTVDLGSKF